jgi:hypothetical protein
VLVRQLREGRATSNTIRAFVATAREQLRAHEALLAERRRRFARQLRSRADLRLTEPCFESEQRSLLYAFESLNGLEAYLKSRNPVFLSEALADFTSWDTHCEKLIALRKRLPAEIQEDLQRAA